MQKARGLRGTRTCLAVGAVVAVLGWAVIPVSAVPFTGSSGNLSASADFSIVGGNLQVVLTNTASADVMNPAQVLTALFFNVAGNPALSRLAAVLTAGSSVFYDADGQPAGGVVGGEWAYKNGLSGAPGSVNAGISSSGLGLFGAGDLFPGPGLQPPASPDGVQYGLLSAGDNTGSGNGGITGSGGLIKHSVTFTLGSLPGNFRLADISDVSFQYGTALTEPNVPGTCLRDCGPGTHVVPEPSTWIMLVTGTLCLLGYGWSRRQAQQEAETSI
jgi:hypothetical protein